MRSIHFLITIVLATHVAYAESNPTPLKPVPLTQVKLTDEFWAPRLETNRVVTIPHNFRMCRQTGRVDNFAKAAGKMPGEHAGFFFNDSDVYKTMEAAAYSLAA